MDLIIGWLQQGFSAIVPIVILLGLLIFVHEMGHFLVAKYFKVRVEVFSLGFGKKIFSFKRGDTNYCVSLVPLGGYVKMFGDGSEPVPDELKHVSFTHKPVGQRIAVVLAGPLMNFFFAILLFGMISLVGEHLPKSVVGDVTEGTAAYNFGFRSGDTITSVNGTSVDGWDDVKKIVQRNEEKPINFEVKHAFQDAVVRVDAQTKLATNDDILSNDIMVGALDGLTTSAASTSVGVTGPESIAAKAGIKTGDFISSINGKEVIRWIDLVHEIDAAKAQNEIVFGIERPKEGKDDTTKTQAKVASAPEWSKKSGDEILREVGLEKPDLFVLSVTPKSAADVAGVKAGDRVTHIDGVSLKSWQDLVGKVTSYKKDLPPLKVDLLRDGKPVSLSVTPQMTMRKTATGHKEETFALGIASTMVSAPPPTYIFKVTNPISAVAIGFHNTVDWSVKTAMSFVRLIQNKVSPSSIGGPIMIGQIASKTFEIGLSPFLKIMAIISINLFILNLLPIPVLDGGHLVFYTIEALRGAPLSMRKMEIAQQVGLVLLMGLMVLSFFNDLSRVFKF